MRSQDVTQLCEAMMQLADRLDAELCQLADGPTIRRQVAHFDDDAFDQAMAQIDAFHARTESALRVAQKCIDFVQQLAAVGPDRSSAPFSPLAHGMRP